MVKSKKGAYTPKTKAYVKAVECRTCGQMAYNGNTIKKQFICNRCQGKSITTKSKRTDKDIEYIEAYKKSLNLS